MLKNRTFSSFEFFVQLWQQYSGTKIDIHIALLELVILKVMQSSEVIYIY